MIFHGQDLTAVIGETDGRWTRLRGDRDVYVADALIKEKRKAKLVCVCGILKRWCLSVCVALSQAGVFCVCVFGLSASWCVFICV
jgi:hypothetical protein